MTKIKKKLCQISKAELTVMILFESTPEESVFEISKNKLSWKRSKNKSFQELW